MEDKRLTGWTDERVELLKKLWLEGKSATDIAQVLGFSTRNPVCGKIDRLGLSGVKRAEREKQQLAAGEKLPRKRNRTPTGGATTSRAERIVDGKKRAETPVLVVVADSEEALPIHIDFMALTEDTCKWAYGKEPADYTFCGSAPKPGFPYCVAHCRMAYVPAEKRKRSDKKDWRRGTSGVFGRGRRHEQINQRSPLDAG